MTDFALATVKAVGDEEGPGQFEAVLSTSTLDRDGEVIGNKAFDPLPVSIPIYFEHDWKSGATPIGRGEPFYDGDVVKLKGVFASTPRAQEIRSLVVEGVVDSMSVGFLNGKREQKSGVRTVTSGEVFEGSLTAIPINTTARVLVAKALSEGAMSAEDIRRIEGRRSAKAVAGSYEQRTCDLYETLRSAYPDADWVETIATFDDRVIYEVHGGVNDDKSFETPYAFDGNEVTLGDPVEVETAESLTVTPVGTSDATTLSLSASEGAGAAAAKAAAAPVTDEAEQAQATFRLLSQLGTA